MPTETEHEPAVPTIEDKQAALETRVAALELALASLGDTVGPGANRGLKAFADWRKTITAK